MTSEKYSRFVSDVMTRELFEELFAVVPLAVMGEGAYRDLLAEIGSDFEVVTWLKDLVNRHGKPLAINRETHSGSVTTFIGPEGWTEERLKGWVGRIGPTLEHEFGDVRSIMTGGEAHKIGRNDPCFCGSGLKFKRCHGGK